MSGPAYTPTASRANMQPQHLYFPVRPMALPSSNPRDPAHAEDKEAIARQWNNAIARHPASNSIIAHGRNDWLRSFAQRETQWFMNAYQPILREKRQPIRVIGLLGLGSLTHPYWAARADEIPGPERVPSEITQLHLFRSRTSAMLTLLRDFFGRPSHYAFACDPSFTPLDVHVLRLTGVAAFPDGFYPGNVGDLYKTEQRHQDVKWKSEHPAYTMHSTPSVFIDPSCPEAIINQAFLTGLTFLDIAGLPWENVFDLLLWAVKHNALDNLALLYEDPFLFSPNPGKKPQEGWNDWFTRNHFLPVEGALLREIFHQAEKTADYPSPPGRAFYNVAARRAISRALLWWHAINTISRRACSTTTFSQIVWSKSAREERVRSLDAQWRPA